MLAVRTITVGIVAAVAVIAGPVVVAGATPTPSVDQAATGAVTAGLQDWPWE